MDNSASVPDFFRGRQAERVFAILKIPPRNIDPSLGKLRMFYGEGGICVMATCKDKTIVAVQWNAKEIARVNISSAGSSKIKLDRDSGVAVRKTQKGDEATQKFVNPQFTPLPLEKHAKIADAFEKQVARLEMELEGSKALLQLQAGPIEARADLFFATEGKKFIGHTKESLRAVYASTVQGETLKAFGLKYRFDFSTPKP